MSPRLPQVRRQAVVLRLYPASDVQVGGALLSDAVDVGRLADHQPLRMMQAALSKSVWLLKACADENRMGDVLFLAMPASVWMPNSVWARAKERT